MNYGLSYKGSKNKLAERITGLLPQANVLYDLFAGGCAITHAALLSGKWNRIVANDISDVPQLFKNGIKGKVNSQRWVSREDFFALKDSDPEVRICWSFGNNGRDYMYSKEIEPYKKACHYAVVFDKWEDLKRLCPEVWETAKNALNGIENIKERRLKFGPSIVRRLKELNDASLLETNPLYGSCHIKGGKISSLERLQSLERLERLQSLERLTILQGDYRDVIIGSNSVIYSDIPYKRTNGYDKKSNGFDYESFYDWACNQSVPVFISEYDMPRDRFECVAEFSHTSSLCATAANKVVERIFVPKKQNNKGITQMCLPF